MKILLVFSDEGLGKGFVDGIVRIENSEVVLIENGALALDYLSKNNFDLAVTAKTLSDMTGIEFIEKLVTINPMINTAVASDLSKKDFHEATEGLGVLMSIPLEAGAKDADGLLDYLYKINMMMSV